MGFFIVGSLLALLLFVNIIGFASAKSIEEAIQYIDSKKGELQDILEIQFLDYLKDKNVEKLESFLDIPDSSAGIFIINTEEIKERDYSLIKEIKAGKSFVSLGNNSMSDILDFPMKTGAIEDEENTYKVVVSHYFYDSISGVPAIEQFMIPKGDDVKSLEKAIPIIIKRIYEERQRLKNNDVDEGVPALDVQQNLTDPQWDYLGWVREFIIDDTEGQVYARYRGYHLLNDGDSDEEYFMLVGNNDYAPGDYHLDEYYETWLPGPVIGGTNPANLYEYEPTSANYNGSFSYRIGAIFAGIPSISVEVSYSGAEPLDIDYLGSGDVAKWKWAYSGQDAITSTQTIRNSVVYSVPQSEGAVFLEGRWTAYFKHPSFGNNPYGTAKRWISIGADSIWW